MINRAARASIVALAVAASLAGASQASAHPIFPGHGPIFPIHGGPIGPGHFPGHFPIGYWGHGPHWGGFGWGGYGGYRVYGGDCVIKRFIDSEGGVIIRKFCD